jgi:hypothetical protein
MRLSFIIGQSGLQFPSLADYKGGKTPNLGRREVRIDSRLEEETKGSYEIKTSNRNTEKAVAVLKALHYVFSNSIYWHYAMDSTISNFLKALVLRKLRRFLLNLK